MAELYYEEKLQWLSCIIQNQQIKMKEKPVEIWQTCDNSGGYVDEKVNKVKNLKNARDNFMRIVAMFNSFNKEKEKL